MKFGNSFGGYIFYIGGIDRTNKLAVDIIDGLLNHVGLDHATTLWRNIITNVNNFVNTPFSITNPPAGIGAGASNYYPFTDFVLQPSWVALRRFLQKNITWLEFKTAMGC